MKTVWLIVIAVLAACVDEFDPYSEVAGHRVLGIRAEPPDLRAGESGTIDALVTSEAPTYAWSWCPFAFGGASGTECPISEDQLRALVAASGSDVVPPAYDLGTAATATFEHTIPKQLLADLCAELGSAELPEGVSLPRCDGRFEVSIMARVAAGGLTIAGFRKLGLIYDDARVPNANPRVVGGRLSVRGAPPFELVVGDVTSVVRDVEYTVEVDVPEDQAETFEDVDEAGQPIASRERLVISWFHEGGELDKNRTSYIDGLTDFTNLRSNSWRTPTLDELATERAHLYFVIRDERGGLDWLTADLELLP